MTKKIIFRDHFSWKVRTFALEIVLNIISHDNSRTQNIHYGGA